MWNVHNDYMPSEDGTQVLLDSRASTLKPCHPDARGLARSPEHLVVSATSGPHTPADGLTAVLDDQGFGKVPRSWN